MKKVTEVPRQEAGDFKDSKDSKSESDLGGTSIRTHR